MNLNPFKKQSRQPPQPQQGYAAPAPQQRLYTQDEVTQLVQQASGRKRENGYPAMELTKDERYICKLLDPNVPNSPQTEPFYIFAGASAPHLALTNIPDPFIYQRMRRKAIDLMRVHGWSAPDYFEMRQLLMLAEANIMKAISYTRSSREREQLNESRTAMTVRDDRAMQPRESHSFVQGFLGGR